MIDSKEKTNIECSRPMLKELEIKQLFHELWSFSLVADSSLKIKNKWNRLQELLIGKGIDL